jgi:hypothetical protein
MPGNLVNVSPADVAKWPPPNYKDPETRNWMPIFVGFLLGFATIMTGVRLWLRAYKKQAGGLGVDDVCFPLFDCFAVMISETAADELLISCFSFAPG